LFSLKAAAAAELIGYVTSDSQKLLTEISHTTPYTPYIPPLNTNNMPELSKQQSNRVSTGTLTKYSFPSSSLNLSTNINVFLPSSASSNKPVPFIIYLAGLTCNEDTGFQKGGFLNRAGELGLGVVGVDTSPRGAGVEGEDDASDFGTGKLSRTRFNSDWLIGLIGAGFYLNATAEKYKKHYNMYDLIVKELPQVLKEANLGLVSWVTLQLAFLS
jgi:S-formylglutathione hydrolase